jgi:hypothetical protein
MSVLAGLIIMVIEFTLTNHITKAADGALPVPILVAPWIV